MDRLPPFARLVLLTSPFILWSLGLVTLYAGHSLACEAGAPRAYLRAGLLAAGLAHIAAMLLLWRGVHRTSAESGRSPRFLRGLTITLAIAAVPALIALIAPAMILRPCV